MEEAKLSAIKAFVVVAFLAKVPIADILEEAAKNSWVHKITVEDDSIIVTVGSSEGVIDTKGLIKT